MSVPSNSGFVVDRDGRRGVIREAQPTASEGSVIVAFDGDSFVVPLTLLERRDDGVFDLPVRVVELTAARQIIPVVREEVVVDTRTETTGRVEVTTVTHERTEEVDVDLESVEVEIERVPIGRPADGPLPIREEGDTVVVPVFEERLVVSKQLILKEEIHIARRRSVASHRESVGVREQEVRIERRPPGGDEDVGE